MVRFMRYSTLFRFYETIQPHIQYTLHVEDELPGENILVLAPHCDDESIGAGGTISRHVSAGKKACIVFCTQPDDTRRKETGLALQALGVSDALFWEFKEETLEKEPTLVDRLITIFEEKRPDIVFVPFFLDNHTDHRALNKALLEVHKKRDFSFLVYAYPVWSPLYPNVLIDIENSWETKKYAISCYKSQLATRDYITMSHSLAQYWAQAKGNKKLLESFFRATFKEYAAFVRKVL